MKPYPLSALNHFTVPVAIDETPPPLLKNGQRRRTARNRYSLRSCTEGITKHRKASESVSGSEHAGVALLFSALAADSRFRRPQKHWRDQPLRQAADVETLLG